MKSRFLGLFAFFILTASPAAALETEHEDWFQVTATGHIHGRWLGFLELQPRFGENPQSDEWDIRAFIARGALGWEVKKGWTLWMGYGYTPTYDPDRDEHRVFQQSQVDWKLGPFNASYRTRLEERMLEHESEASIRLRNQMRLLYPLPRFPTWSLVAADELFLDLNGVKKGSESGFDQNRLFLGVSHQWNKHVRLELDYLNQMVQRDRGSEDVMRHSLFLQVALGW